MAIGSRLGCYMIDTIEHAVFSMIVYLRIVCCVYYVKTLLLLAE